MFPFRGKKTVILETDEEKAKKDLFKMVQGLLFNSQKNYKVFLRHHKTGEFYKPRIIYYVHQGKLIRVPRS